MYLFLWYNTSKEGNENLGFELNFSMIGPCSTYCQHLYIINEIGVNLPNIMVGNHFQRDLKLKSLHKISVQMHQLYIINYISQYLKCYWGWLICFSVIYITLLKLFLKSLFLKQTNKLVNINTYCSKISHLSKHFVHIRHYLNKKG